MSIPCPNVPWGQPELPRQPGQPATSTPGGDKRAPWIGLGVLVGAVLGVGALLVACGGDDSSDRDRTDRTNAPAERTDAEPSGAEGDPDDAVDVATDFVQALIDAECAGAAVRATDGFIEETLDTVCGEPSGTTEITDAALRSADPVIVAVSTTTDGQDDGDTPLLMVYEDGNWLVDSFHFGVDAPPDPEAPASGDPEEMAQLAVQAMIDGDCDAALALATGTFAETYGDEICAGEFLPPDATITGVEQKSDDPVIVSVDLEAGGESVTIRLVFAFEYDRLLIAGYRDN